MEPLHARYPFLPAAREAVQAVDVDLGAVVEDSGAVVKRAAERVQNAIGSHTVGDPHRSDRVELLSYPVARVLVSLVDEPALLRRYAAAEARAAIDRLHADAEEGNELRSVQRARLPLDAFLEAMNLDTTIAIDGEPITVDVATYLRLTDELNESSWRLVNRSLDDGRVPVSRTELDDLLVAAVEDRVADDLPVSVPPVIESALAETVESLRSLLSDRSIDRSFDVVEPDRFPPCVQALARRIVDESPLPEHSRFAYVAFLAAIGMEAEAIRERLADHPGIDAETVAYRVDHLRTEAGAAYPPPSCATMQAYGDCVNQDDLCAQIAHPLEYYKRRLDGAEPEAAHSSRAESQ